MTKITSSTIIGKKIGLITFPGGKSGIIPVSNLINILLSTSEEIIFISNIERIDLIKNYDSVHLLPVVHRAVNNPIHRIISYLYTQIKISLEVIKNSQNLNLWFFFIGGDTLIIPLLSVRFFGNKVLIVIAGSSIKTLESKKDPLNSGLKILQYFTCRFANKIILYSTSLITDYGLSIWKNKILIAHRHFLDFTIFTVTTPFSDRLPLIGYIGRLSAEKGAQHFIQALPTILSKRQDLRVLIGGDGQLKQPIEASLQEGRIADRVGLPGWISHDDLPKYLNQLRLLILPSYTEGLPNIMLEAMACGTPVLATPVGAIPDVIRDGETGFIMEDNSPECIARNVLRALSDPDLERVAERGRRYVEGEYTFEKAVERWRRILEELNDT